jgi:hypothetical protein
MTYSDKGDSLCKKRLAVAVNPAYLVLTQDDYPEGLRAFDYGTAH